MRYRYSVWVFGICFVILAIGGCSKSLSSVESGSTAGAESVIGETQENIEENLAEELEEPDTSPVTSADTDTETESGINTETEREDTLGNDEETSVLGNHQMLKTRNYYASLLSRMIYKDEWPDGEKSSFHGDGEYTKLEDNRFAILDIDQDGKEELLFDYTVGSMADMVEYVYSYNPATGDLTKELTEFPGVVYYQNGMAEAGASHNQSMGNAVWPYQLYQYNRNTGVYDRVAAVSSWEKEMFATDAKGNAFPEEVDGDGNGIIYCINDPNDETTYLDDAEYQEWYDKQLGDGAKLGLNTQPLSETSVSEYSRRYLSYLSACMKTKGVSGRDIGCMMLERKSSTQIRQELVRDHMIEVQDSDDTIAGYMDEQEVITFYGGNNGKVSLNTDTDRLSILGLRPNMEVSRVREFLLELGFEARDDNMYVSGDGIGNFAISFETENDKITKVYAMPWCAYVD